MDVPQQTVCAQCRNPAKKKCGRCNSVAYCSKECQIAHWPLHKDDCALIVKFAMESDPMVEIGVKRKAEDQPTEEVERRPEKRVRKDGFSLDKLSPELLLDSQKPGAFTSRQFRRSVAGARIHIGAWKCVGKRSDNQ